MIGAAAPLAPAAAEALAALGLVLAFVVAWGLRRVWAHSIGWLFVHLADLFDQVRVGAFGIGGHPLGFVSSFLRSVNAKVDHALASAALASERSAVYLFGLATDTVLFVAHGLADLAEATEHALSAGLVGSVSKAVASLTATVGRQIRALQATLTHVERVALPAIRAQARALDRLTHDQFRRFANGIDRLSRDLAHRVTRAVAAVGARVGHLERTLRGQTKRLGKVERATVGVGAAALVGAALARLGMSWLRCRNVTKVGKSVCAMDSDLLDELLLGSLAVFGAVSVVEFAKELRAIEGEAVKVIGAIVREFPD